MTGQQLNNPLPLYFLHPKGMMQFDGIGIKMSYDPASPDGDYSCEVKYKVNKKGEREVVSWRIISPKPPLGKKRKPRNG